MAQFQKIWWCSVMLCNFVGICWDLCWDVLGFLSCFCHWVGIFQCLNRALWCFFFLSRYGWRRQTPNVKRWICFYRGDLPLENSLDLLKMFFELASGTLTVCELENGHRNSWFTHETWYVFIVFLMGTPLLINKVICFLFLKQITMWWFFFEIHWWMWPWPALEKNWKSFMGAEYLSSKVCGWTDPFEIVKKTSKW